MQVDVGCKVYFEITGEFISLSLRQDCTKEFVSPGLHAEAQNDQKDFVESDDLLDCRRG
jgi:hypothetical protein